jgi:hypothetical protein
MKSGALSVVEVLPALGITQELFGSSEENQSHLDKLMIRSKKGDETATREAIVFIAFALDEKLEEAFEE